MGIVNATDDSYFYKSRVNHPESFTNRVNQLISDGASIIDIGACSTRPGFTLISEEEEWDRLYPLLEVYKERFRNTTLSIDTFRSAIIRRASELLGFEFIVNDISSGDFDAEMLPTVGRLGLTYIAMHHKGSISTMHEQYHYDDIVADVIEYFIKFANLAEKHKLKGYYIDPGFGFSKSIDDNVELLKRVGELRVLNRPILIGISRKSFIYQPLGLKPEDDKVLDETRKWQEYAINSGVSILRVHDIPKY